jgi:hypothetical protein
MGNCSTDATAIFSAVSPTESDTAIYAIYPPSKTIPSTETIIHPTYL